MSDGRNNRSRQAAANAEIARAEGFDSGSSGQVGVTTYVSAYPTVAQACYAFHPVVVGGVGDEVEGGPVPFAVDSTTILYAFNLGTIVPGIGTYFELSPVDAGRNVFRCG